MRQVVLVLFLAEKAAIGQKLLEEAKEAGVEIESVRAGSYIDYREFEDAELHMLIDGVLSSRYITAARSKDLINRICGLSSKYFKSSVKHIHSVNDWSKTANTTVFYNIETIGKGIQGAAMAYPLGSDIFLKLIHSLERRDSRFLIQKYKTWNQERSSSIFLLISKPSLMESS